jgi:hypothetical protein
MGAEEEGGFLSALIAARWDLDCPKEGASQSPGNLQPSTRQRTFTHANSPVAPSSLRIDTLLRGPLSTILRRSSPISTYSAILALFMGETDNHSVVSMERLKKGIQYDSCTFRRSSTLSLFVPKCMLTHFHSPQDTRLPLNHVEYRVHLERFVRTHI